MKRFCIITGTSSGIGEELARISIQKRIPTMGISRRPSNFKSQFYAHISCDLNVLDSIQSIEFPVLDPDTEVVCINNAGIIGEIAHLGKSENFITSMSSIMQINALAVMALTHRVLEFYSNQKSVQIINVSSGAANSNIDGWSAYCASKAAVDQFTRVLANEMLIQGKSWSAHALYPGTVDTEMQVAIRSADTALGFSQSARFHDLKETNTLRTVNACATAIWEFVDLKSKPSDVVCRI